MFFPAGLNRFDRERGLRAMQLTLEQFLQELVALMKQAFPNHLRRMIAETEGLVWIQSLEREKMLIRITTDYVGVGSVIIFFNKQKTAYEIRLSLVGSEMCI